MVKPWNAKPGKIWRANKPEKEVQENLKKRKEFGEKWDNIFGKKKLNNMEDSKEEDD